MSSCVTGRQEHWFWWLESEEVSTVYQGGDVPWAVKNPENDDKGSAVGAGKSWDSHLCDPLGGGGAAGWTHFPFCFPSLILQWYECGQVPSPFWVSDAAIMSGDKKTELLGLWGGLNEMMEVKGLTNPSFCFYASPFRILLPSLHSLHTDLPLSQFCFDLLRF